MSHQRTVKKLLFVRRSYLDGRDVLVAVECYGKDHAISRLLEKYPYVEKRDWHFVDELDPEHFCGIMGTDLPLPSHEKTTIARLVSKLIH